MKTSKVTMCHQHNGNYPINISKLLGEPSNELGPLIHTKGEPTMNELKKLHEDAMILKSLINGLLERSASMQKKAA